MAKFGGTTVISGAPVKGSAAGSTVALPTGSGTVSVKMPAPARLTINGVATPIIDVANMTAAEIVTQINSIGQGNVASLDGQGRLVLNNVVSLDGDPRLKAFFGF